MILSPNIEEMEKSSTFSVADPGGGHGGHGPPPSVPDKDYLLCTSWHFLVKNNEF